MADPRQKTAIWDVPPPAAPRSIESENALPVGTRIAEFEIRAVIGEGGFGIVYLADDLSLERQVAVKEYMPSSLATRSEGASVRVRSERYQETFATGMRSFVNEAKLLAKFDHPSLVKVYRFWEQNGTAYMVMPYYQGLTLKQALLARGCPPEEAWLRAVLDPILDAVEILHREHCYHRDIAPDNILLLAEGRPLLLDFGAARRVISDLTQNLTVILKPGYAPIEQYAEVPGLRQGPWTDIYALAAVAYFAVTGKTPPPSVGRMVNDSFESLSSIAAGRYGASFLRAIDAALSLRPEQRPADIAAFRALLNAGPVAGTEAGTSGPGRTPEPPPAGASHGTIAPAHAPAAGMPSPVRRGRAAVPLAAAAAVALMAGGAAWWMLGGKDASTAGRYPQPAPAGQPAATRTPPEPQVMPPPAPAPGVMPAPTAAAPPATEAPVARVAPTAPDVVAVPEAPAWPPPAREAAPQRPRPAAPLARREPPPGLERYPPVPAERVGTPAVDLRQVRCTTLVEAGERALQANSYDQAMANAREATALASNCPGAHDLLQRARSAKDRARSSLVIE